jgi:hypothetical protein
VLERPALAGLRPSNLSASCLTIDGRRRPAVDRQREEERALAELSIGIARQLPLVAVLNLLLRWFRPDGIQDTDIEPDAVLRCQRLDFLQVLPFEALSIVLWQ